MPAERPDRTAASCALRWPMLTRVARASGFDREDGPIIAPAKQRADRHGQRRVGFPDGDMNDHAVIMSKPPHHSSEAGAKSMVVRTRCSSMPSAETLTKPIADSDKTWPYAMCRCSEQFVPPTPPPCTSRTRVSRTPRASICDSTKSWRSIVATVFRGKENVQ